MRFVLLSLVLMGPCLSQGPRGFFPWWEMPIARDLNLTDQQSRDIQAITRGYRNQMIDLRAAVEKAEGELEDLFNEESIDQRRGNDAVERLVHARAELTRALSQMNLKLRAILTAAQWRELQRRRPAPGSGPGGPGRMMPGGPNPDRPPGGPGPRPQNNP